MAMHTFGSRAEKAEAGRCIPGEPDLQSEFEAS